MKAVQGGWNRMGMQARLLLPVLLVVLLAGCVRSYFVLEADKKSAVQSVQADEKGLYRALSTVLISFSDIGDHNAIRRILQALVAEHPDLVRVEWQSGESSVVVDAAAIHNLKAPSWFARWLGLPDTAETLPVAEAGKRYGSIILLNTHTSEINKIWDHFLLQVQSLIVLIWIVFGVVILVLRSNVSTLKQLADAARSLAQGRNRGEVPVLGSVEVRAAVEAYNQLADYHLALLQSVQIKDRIQQEQLHFARQLIAKLPVPVYSKAVDGTYLGVNEAWESVFGLHADAVLGKSVLALYPFAPDIAEWHHEMDTELLQQSGKQIIEGAHPVADGSHRDAVHYKATFSRCDGSLGGLVGAIVDITEHKRVEAALSTDKERAEETLWSIVDAVITTDIAGRIKTLNPLAQQLTGWSFEEALDQQVEVVFNVINEASRQPAFSIASKALAEGKGVEGTNIVLQAKDGKEFAIEDSAAPIRDKNGNMLGCVIVFHDVSEKLRLIQQMSWQAGHDTLTNLPNRVLLSDRLKRAIASAQRQNKLLAVCLLDLDEFKPVNDQYGHEVGDRLLVEVAERLVGALRGGDTVARMGGDEFVLLLNDLKDMDEMEPALNRVLVAMSAPYMIQGVPLVVSASIGVTIYPFDDSDPDTLMRHADQGMYLAKQSGRNRIRMFDAEQDQLVQDRHLKLERVRQALQHGELILYYQPKVNMRSGEVIGMEALLRWQHPERGLLPPLEFLPLVEQSDLIVDIGEWVIHEALCQIASWAEVGLKLPVSVNIAAHHLQRADFVSRLTEILGRHISIPPRMLELEILESDALEDIQAVRAVIVSCQAMGVSFSLDDFGTGYSSLTYLKQLSANTLKIDQSFVRNMLDDKEDLALVEGVIGLASVFNREVIAEGVETVEHGVMLMRLGCDAAQGYGIARPMPSWEVVGWVNEFMPHPGWALWADRGWELNDFPLLVAQYDHVKWVQRVLNAVDDDAPLQLSQAELTDKHHCRFGHWYYGHGLTHYGSLPEFIEIEAVHNQVHEIGPRIIELKNMGEIYAAKSLCLTLLQLRDQTLERLADLQRVLSKPGRLG